jgi:hypothetical protein
MDESIENENLQELEEIINDCLNEVHELEYAIMHFMKKTNKSTALAVRNSLRSMNNCSKEFKRISIEYFGN